MAEQLEFDLPGIEKGKREERVEWGQRAIRDSYLVGPKGTVRPAVGEEHAKAHGGAFYTGGPIETEAVKRTIVVYTGPWEADTEEAPTDTGDPS